MDGRDKPGHDGESASVIRKSVLVRRPDQLFERRREQRRFAAEKCRVEIGVADDLCAVRTPGLVVDQLHRRGDIFVDRLGGKLGRKRDARKERCVGICRRGIYRASLTGTS